MYKMASICKRGATVMKSSLIRINLIFILLLILFIPNLTSAESKKFIKEYTYQASEDDSKNSSRTIALREIKRLLLEELGTYLESETEVKNFQLTKDQITTLTAGIVKTEIMDEKWDGKSYYLKAKILADPEVVVKSIDLLRKDRDKFRELEEIRKKVDELFRENEILRSELKTAKGPDIQKKKQEYADNIKQFPAVEWFERGNLYFNRGDYERAIHEFKKAVELSPNWDRAFFNLALIQEKTNQYNDALANFEMYLKLSPNAADAKSVRGKIYELEYKAKIDSSKRPLPRDEDAERHLIYGNTAFKERNIPLAIQAYKKAMELSPKLASVYYNLGLAQEQAGQYDESISNLKKYLILAPNAADASYVRSKIDILEIRAGR